MTLVDIGSGRDLWNGETRVVHAGHRRLLIIKLDDHVVAYEDACQHLGLSLEKAALEGGLLRCAHHGWTYDARTGAGVNPQGVCLARVPVEMRAERILVDVGDGGTA